MRTLKLCVAVGLILSLSGAAWAVTLPSLGTGPLRLKYTNWDMGASYTNPAEWPEDGGSAAMDILAQTGPVGGVAGEDAWFVFRVTDIWNNWQGGNKLWDDGELGTEIVGMGYGLVDVGIGNLGSVLSIDYTVELWAQPHGTFDHLLGSSGRINATSYTNVGAPGGVVDSVLLWKVTSISDANVGLPPGENFGTPPTYEHIAASTGRSDMYVTGVGGLWSDGNIGNGEVLPSTFKDWYSGLPVTQDGHIKSSVVDYIQQGANDDWMFFSEDPLRVSYAVPEPLTMAGLFVGVTAVGAYLRKRRAV